MRGCVPVIYILQDMLPDLKIILNYGGFKMEDEKDAFDILLDRLENLENKLKNKEKSWDSEKKEDVKKDEIDKSKEDAIKKETQAIDEKLKEKMKRRGLL